jgi:hypothetical protein
LPIHVREAMTRLARARKLLLDDDPSWLRSVYRGENLNACYQEDLRLVAYLFTDSVTRGD